MYGINQDIEGNITILGEHETILPMPDEEEIANAIEVLNSLQ
jgi:hypothetical protein